MITLSPEQMDELVDKIASATLLKIKHEPGLILDLPTNLRVSAAVVGLLSTGRQFIEYKGLSGAPQHPHRYSMYDQVMRQISASGMCLEFGVAGGHSIRHCAGIAPERTFHGFDSFVGLPEAWHEHGPGAYTQGGVFPDAPENVKFIKGWFDDTLPGFVETHKAELEADGIALLHIDSDIYSAAKTIFNLVGDYVRPNTIIMFDEFWNHTTWEHDEHKAWLEFLAEKPGLTYKFHSYVPTDVQLSVQVLTV
jgi:Methyltransferase domain